jgi:DNA (cytosine-5)-methyltransferase 1
MRLRSRCVAKWADLLPSVPEGSRYLYFTDRGSEPPLLGWRPRYWNLLLKLAENQPSWTLMAQPGTAQRTSTASS